METKGTTNESNLPEKGVQDINSEAVSNEIKKELVNENVEISEVNEVTEPQIEAEIAEEISSDNEESIEVDEDIEVESEEEEDQLEDIATDEFEAQEELKTKTPKFVAENYSELDRPALLEKLNSLINSYNVEIIRDAVEEIKTVFYKHYKAEVAEARTKFEENGGVAEDFKFNDETSEETFKILYSRFKEKRAEINQKVENSKAENLRLKYQIIDEINELINKEESINKTFHEFRDLQQRWRDLGLVPQNAVRDLWENYNHTVEKFYDFIKINKELRDLDLKKNLELKIELCEKTEALLIDDSVTKAFKLLQDFHNQWREIGPVPTDQKDDIWERFKAATTLINKKHQDFFEGLKDQQVKNLEQKTALCERVEELITIVVEKPKEWEEKALELIEIQKLWRTVGFAPKKDNNKIYQRFKNACDDFFARKRDFYKEAKEIQKNHLQLKLDLCVQAEALKDSTEWKKTTEDFIKLQKRWKEIGPVPKKHSEILWKRFRTACDSFFNSKSAFYSTVDSRYDDNLKLKLELIEKVKGFQKAQNDKENLKQLMDIQKEWSEIGHVPINKKDEIQKEFRDAINAQFETMKIDDNERNKLNFKSKVDTWVNTNSRNKIYSERNKLVTKIKELENEIALYENNIGFFSASSNAQSLMNEVTRKIEKAKEFMESQKQKLKLLDKAEDTM